jgi:hypothetical protein
LQVENVKLTPHRFLREVSLHVSGTGWRAYDHFIGQPIFYSGFSENMTAAVLSTPILQKRITELAEKRIAVEEKDGLLNKDDPSYAAKRYQRKTVIEQSLNELCEKLTGDMICKMESKPFIRSAYYLCTQLLTRAYHQGIFSHILCSRGGINVLQAFMCPVKKSCDYERWRRRQRRTSKA